MRLASTPDRARLARRAFAIALLAGVVLVPALAPPLAPEARADEEPGDEGEEAEGRGRGRDERPEERVDEGPNFEVPADLPAKAAGLYRDGVAAYEAALAAREGQSEKIAAAVKALRRAKDAAPKFPPPNYYLGILYQSTKEYEKARQVLRTACDLNPKFHQAIVELGDTYMWLKRESDALKEYERAIAVSPGYGRAYAMRGYHRLKTGEAAAALADLDLAKKNGERSAGIEAIRRMARREVDGPGWKTTFTCETEHYRVMTPVSQAFADELGMHAELIHRTYTRIFPKVSKEKRKFPIVVHQDRAGYQAGGGPPSAGGHYEPLIRKLVLYRYEDDADTRLVLYHEGFHQFLHDYLEDAPQWFDEGLGDFFGPSRHIPPKKGERGPGRLELRPNPWRLRTIQQAIGAGRVRPWRQLMLMSQAELYDPQWAGIHYAQSWSIIYFLVRGNAAPGLEAGPHFKLLQEYFKALRRGDGQETAFATAFKDVDLAAIEKEWREFVLGLPAE